jgi:hypothetical protein
MDGRLERGGASNPLVRTAVALLILASAAFLILKARPAYRLIDFDCLWYAGYLWNHGLNPYGPDFDRLKATLFAGGEQPISWVYPPHFWIIVAPIARLPMMAAQWVWNGLNLVLLVTGVALWGAVARSWALPAKAVAAALFVYLTFMTATGGAFSVGQTSFLMWFGFALLAFGLTGKRDWAAAIGIAILLLKPQIGAVAFATLLVFPGKFRVAVMAGLLVGLLSLPALAIGGVTETILSFLHNLGNYRSIDYNLPDAMTGVSNLVAVWGGMNVSATVATGIAVVLAPLLFVISARATPFVPSEVEGHPIGKASLDFARDERVGRYLAITLGVIAALVPLHVYDLIPLAAMIPLLWSLCSCESRNPDTVSTSPTVVGSCFRRSNWLVLGLGVLGLLLILRPENIARLTHLDEGPTTAAIGCLLIFAAALTAALSRRA